MRKMFCYFFLVIAMVTSISAQPGVQTGTLPGGPFTAITHTGITNGDGSVLTNGKECFAPVNNQGIPITATYTAGNGTVGTIYKTPACAKVSAGNIVGTYNIDGTVTLGAFRLVNTTITKPLNLCYQMTLVNTDSGQTVIGVRDGWS